MHSLWMGRREEDAQIAAFGRAEDGCAFRANRVEDGAHVVHSLLERRESIVGHAVGEARSTLVEQDQARERGEPVQEVRVLRDFPALLDVRDPPWDPDQVEGLVADDLVGDADLAASRITGLRLLHAQRLSNAGDHSRRIISGGLRSRLPANVYGSRMVALKRCV
jgi:hypothetical protein